MAGNVITETWVAYAFERPASPERLRAALLRVGAHYGRQLETPPPVRASTGRTEGMALWRHADEDIGQEPEVFHVTVCPYEAQDYLDGDVMVEGVPIPDLVAHWMQGYIARHHVDAPFEKRRRKRHGKTEPAIEEDEFG